MKQMRKLSRRSQSLCWTLLFLSVLSSLPACEEKTSSSVPQDKNPSSEVSKSAANPIAPPSKETVQGSKEKKVEAVGGEKPKLNCPEGMKVIPGGQFWIGTEREVFDREENPRFQTKLPSFCADVFEVSTNEYESCVSSGACTEPSLKNLTCNSVEKGKGEHPINCISYEQAQNVCAKREARLPTEIEWEYLARGGSQMRSYPWGESPPDGNTCWKHPGTCERGKDTEGAFGLHDVVGNVWEWTDSWFGPYPWPQKFGKSKVFRGGSWSRRFEKWMRPTLRNRVDPKSSGSHLGVRCVASLKGETCPYGSGKNGACLAGVDAVVCLDGEEWNGARCTKPGNPNRCPERSTEEKGHGCVSEAIAEEIAEKLDLSSVTRARSPEFDSDCLQNTPGRPTAYRFSGGGHLARNAVGDQLGCKNRDVGVGFNSSCCPN